MASKTRPKPTKNAGTRATSRQIDSKRSKARPAETATPPSRDGWGVLELQIHRDFRTLRLDIADPIACVAAILREIETTGGAVASDPRVETLRRFFHVWNVVGHAAPEELVSLDDELEKVLIRLARRYDQNDVHPDDVGVGASVVCQVLGLDMRTKDAIGRYIVRVAGDVLRIGKMDPAVRKLEPIAFVVNALVVQAKEIRAAIPDVVPVGEWPKRLASVLCSDALAAATDHEALAVKILSALGPTPKKAWDAVNMGKHMRLKRPKRGSAI